MLVAKISKDQFVALMKRFDYNKWSDAGLETIYDIEMEFQAFSETKPFVFDHPAIRGAYSEYDSLEEAAKDLGYDNTDDLEMRHNHRTTRSGTVIIY
ncbi:MAG: hypothetical protein KBT06_04405 [Prevotellaceae bacterium]|nr:hypothetical protein [Candidatus Colivivens equi]